MKNPRKTRTSPILYNPLSWIHLRPYQDRMVSQVNYQHILSKLKISQGFLTIPIKHFLPGPSRSLKITIRAKESCFYLFFNLHILTDRDRVNLFLKVIIHSTTTPTHPDSAAVLNLHGDTFTFQLDV